MLEYLHIENIAVAKDIDISFANGFNVLTGETGAGKSVIIDSINMILGSKVSKDIIRHGEDRAVASALFSNVNNRVYLLCEELGIPYDKDDMFSVSRSFSKDGKNVIKINSKPATLAQLKQIGELLVNVHGQNDNQSFMNKSNHILMLDEYVSFDGLLLEYKDVYSKLNEIKQEITKIYEENKQKSLIVDALKFQIKEIEASKLKDINEEEKLVELRKRLKSAETLIKSTSVAYKALFKHESGVSAKVLIDKAIDALEKIADVDSSITEMIEKLEQVSAEIEDIAERARELGAFDGIENPQKQLDVVEERLALIQRLEKKYGPSIEEILKFKYDAEEKLRSFETSEERLEELKKEYKLLHQKGCDIAEKIHEIRVNGADKLSEIIKDALVFLDMPKVKFKINVSINEKEGKPILSSLGFDDVEFLISTNPGESLASMNKIASGGELARIMLALKSALTDKNGAQTVIFDEIDVGVSGSTSQKIGIKLYRISEGTQVICVTHSAQIAAFSENHFLIKKHEIDGRAETKINLLSEKERIDELARIIGGTSLTENQYAAAKELIDESLMLLKKNI